MGFLDRLLGGPKIRAGLRFSEITIENATREYEHGRISEKEALAIINKERKSIGNDALTKMYGVDEELRAKRIAGRNNF